VIAPFGGHALQRTFSAYNGNSGGPMPALQPLLGLTRAETTMIYTHPPEGAPCETVEQLARILFPNVPNLVSDERCSSSLIQCKDVR
jgi:hypothetical protein